MNGLLVISTAPRDALYGELWDWVEREGGQRLVVDGDGAAAEAAVAAEAGVLVVLDANLRRMKRQVLRLQGVPRLVIFDHDMCQHFVRSSDWYGLYVPLLKRIAPILTITSNLHLAGELARHGVKAEFLPKAFSPRHISRRPASHDIPLGFVGRTRNKVYQERKKFLDRVARHFDVVIARADAGEAYDALLHRIGIFLSADIGFREHMIKNYEALAAGCLLMACAQGDEHLLGLEDGVNVILYRDLDDALRRLAWLRDHPRQAEEIRRRGLEVAWTTHTWAHRAVALRDMLGHARSAPRNAHSLSLRERLRLTVAGV